MWLIACFIFSFHQWPFGGVGGVRRGIKLGAEGKISGLLFADDFVGVRDSQNQIQKLIDIVYAYCCCKWPT